MRRRSLAAIFAMPLLVAVVSLAGLIAGLVGDGLWDAASWAGLGVPVAIGIARWRGRSRATSYR